MAEPDPELRPISLAQVALWATVASVVFGISIALLVSSTPDPNPRWMTPSSYGVGAWGLAVSIVGFSLTLWQLRRAQTVNIAVRDTVAKLNKTVGSLEIITELRSIGAASADAQTRVTDGQWPLALLAYNKIRAGLSKIRGIVNILSPDETEELLGYITHALDACTLIEDRLAGEQIDANEVRFNSRLREIEDFATRMEISLKDKFRAE